MENETAALASFPTSFLSLIFFSGMHPAGYHAPRAPCGAAAASSALGRRGGSAAPCRAGPSPRDPSSSYPMARSTSDKRVLLVLFMKKCWGKVFGFFFFWLRGEFLSGLIGREMGLALALPSIARVLSHEWGTQHQTAVFFRQRRNWTPSSRTHETRKLLFLSSSSFFFFLI